VTVPAPYYQDDACTIYHGDCREILPLLPKVDLVLTDPPYGIGHLWVGGFKGGWKKAGKEAGLRNEWDKEAPAADVFEAIQAAAKFACIWGGNYFLLPPSRGWLVWEKPERNFTLAEAELAWTNKDMVIRVWNGPRSEPGREHPTQKPLKLMKWCIEKMGGGGGGGADMQTILDPFMGSGTTLRAAKDLGRKAIGIELEEKYCEIAVKRLRQEVLL
jgi:DNA modification methylase